MKCPKCKADNPDDQDFCGKCGQLVSPMAATTKSLETPREELTTGSTFAGRYKIVEELGKGGMGKVYRAVDNKLNEEVALKLIKPEIASDKKTIQRFSNELKLARKVSHRNVGRMYEFLEEKGTHFITMEYVPGQDLKGLIRQTGQLAVGTTISIAKQVCEGLSEAHRLGVIHRDLKPNNIMIDKGGNARIMDFGIARTLSGKSITRAGAMIGTPEYMSPEQAEAEEVDHRSDIYSLGVILYEMVTGQLPFEGETALSVAMKHKGETPKDPTEYNPQISDDLSGLILKCLEKEKEGRYQEAGELLSELNNIEQGIPTTDRVVPRRRTTTAKEITVTLNLRKVLVPLLVISVVVVIVGIVMWYRRPPELIDLTSTGKPTLAVLDFDNTSNDENLEKWRASLSFLLYKDLQPSKFINVLQPDRIYNILTKLELLEAKYSTEDLINIANQGRADYILTGRYIKVGEDYIITATLWKSQSAEVRLFEIKCKGEEEILSQVDKLTKQIKSALNLSAEQIDSDFDYIVRDITTPYPEALELYVEGLEYRYSGDVDQSNQSLEEAIEIDSGFAMAYRTLAMNKLDMAYLSEAKIYLEKALEYEPRMSKRELYLIRGDYYSLSERTYEKALEAYIDLLKLYPEDVFGNTQIGNLYMIIEDWDKAIVHFEKNVEKNVEDVGLYQSLAVAYIRKGMDREAIVLLNSYNEKFQENSLAFASIAEIYFSQEKYDLALAEIEKAFLAEPQLGAYLAHIYKGNIHFLNGEFIDAEEECQELLDSDEDIVELIGIISLGIYYQSQGRYKIAIEQLKQAIRNAKDTPEQVWEAAARTALVSCYLNSGNPEDALEECNKALIGFREVDELSGQRMILYAKGRVYLMMEKPDEARKIAEELENKIDEGMNKKEKRRYYHLMGCIELEKKNYSGAIENFKNAIPLLLTNQSGGGEAYYRDKLALAYYESGDLENAKVEYNNIISYAPNRLSYGDIYAKSHYMLGKIFQGEDNIPEAINNYNTFLSLWSEADPDILEDEVKYAQEQIKILK